jgi:hypothetical protein
MKEARVRKSFKKMGQKMKKCAEVIVPRCQDVNFKQIYKIQETNQISSYHDGSHRATMDFKRATMEKAQIQEKTINRAILHLIKHNSEIQHKA